MACKRPVGHVHVEHCYPDKDECGGEVQLTGFWVEYLPPGCTEPEHIVRSSVFTPYPGYVARIPVPQDGQYAFRTISVSGCVESDPSDWVPFYVNLSPPVKSEPPRIVVPCPM